MAFLRVIILIWADLLAGYVMWIMQTYLTDVWKVGFTRAAGIMNVANGLPKVLPIVFYCFVAAGLGNYWMLLLSSLSYAIGLGFLSMSTPPVLAKSTGTCKRYEPQCIGHTQKALFYTSLALIAVGISGHVVSLVEFFVDQFDKKRETKPDDSAEVDQLSLQFQPAEALLALVTKEKKKVKRACILVLVPVIAIFVFPYIKPWSLRFGISAICTLVAFLFFLLGSCEYKEDKSKGETFNICSEVEQTKIVIHTIPIWISLIICGLVTAMGSTYFVEQANHMNYKLGKWKLPDSLLLLVYTSGKSVFKFMYRGIDSFRFRIALATISSALCCVVAAVVETRRIHVIRDHGLINKPDEDIPMTVFYLVPQYLLLACLDSFYENSVTPLSDQSSPSMQKYLVFLSNGLSGLGIIGSILSVYVVGRVSKRQGKPNWFQDTLNESRLDRYYWTIAVLSALNFIWFSVFASVCPCRKLPSKADGENGNQAG